MTKELVVSASRHEAKVAILEDDQLVEVYFQRANEYSLAGSIHKGRVTRVLPGMQSAFVDLGLERDAFLYVTDFFEESGEEYEQVSAVPEDRPPRSQPPPPDPTAAAPEIPAQAVEPAAPAPVGGGIPREGPDPQGGGDPQDRYGRRGRRRRGGRGRPFPESKYASESTRPEERPAPLPAPPPAEAPAASEEFSMLPGESLAKYTRPDAEEVAGGGAATASAAGHAPALEAAVESDSAEEEAPAEPETEVRLPWEEDPGDPPATVTAPEEQPSPQRDPAASVRERTPRYVQRPLRRVRGRPEVRRDGGRQESRPEAERSNQSAPQATPRPEKSSGASIAELVKEGQEILVQIAKEPLGQKGARITSHIALPGRYVVYMPMLDHFGVSRRIASDGERQRLRRILQTHRAGFPGGFIMRTAGEGRSEQDIANDMKFLGNLWQEIRRRADEKPAPSLLHHDLDLVQRMMRDQFNEQFKAVWVDNEQTYETIVGFLNRFQPGLVSRVKLYTRPTPIFDAFNITAELEKALRPKVWLKSGGYIVLNQTEALVAIDVNTGKYVGKSSRLEDTIVKTNTDAIKEIVRQVRLRDLGGIIVVDFIDMDERKNRQKVMQVLEEAMRADRAPYKILQFNDFGLVAITRKRVKQSLERALCSPCPHCEGSGYVKSVQTVIGEILAEARKVAGVLEGREVMLRAHPDVARELKSRENHLLEEIEEILGRPVLVTGDAALHREKFDLV